MCQNLYIYTSKASKRSTFTSSSPAPGSHRSGEPKAPAARPVLMSKAVPSSTSDITAITSSTLTGLSGFTEKGYGREVLRVIYRIRP